MSSDSYVTSISIFCENGKNFYIVDGYKYDAEFPIIWALNHLSISYEDSSGNIFINGSGPKECENCREYGTFESIFKEYCTTCLVNVYNGQRYIPQFAARFENSNEEEPYEHNSDMEIDEEDEYSRREKEEAREEEILAIRIDKFSSRHY